MTVEVKIKRLDEDMPLPCYAKPGDAGMDLRSREDLVLKPGERAIIHTGIAISIPDGYAAFVMPRSGLALKNGFSIVNTPGLIDSGYRGEIGVIGINHDLTETFEVHRGDRIAQLVIQKIPEVQVMEVDELDVTERGTTGFGSSGVTDIK